MIRVTIEGGADGSAEIEGSGAVALVKIADDPAGWTVSLRGVDTDDLAYALLAFGDALSKVAPEAIDIAERIAETIEDPIPTFIVDHSEGGSKS